MTAFDKTWARQETKSMTDKIRDTVRPQGALKPRIQVAVNKLQVQTSKMDSMLTKLRERDQQLFERIVTATREHDTSASRVLSSELAEVRKVSRMLGNARISLEQVQLRLTTIHDLGDAMVSIGPAMSTMKGLKSSLGRFMPEADAELTSIRLTPCSLMSQMKRQMQSYRKHLQLQSNKQMKTFQQYQQQQLLLDNHHKLHLIQ